MAEFTAKDVQALRKASGAGMMDAKKALQENDGDAEAAAKWLREKGLAKMAGRSDRENAQGTVAMAIADGAGAVVQLKCETDFVAKSDDFVALVQEMADAIAAGGPDAAAGFAGRIEDMRVTLKEHIEVGDVVHFGATDGHTVGGYLHSQDGRGVNGVLVELAGGDADLVKNIAMHVSFDRPKYVRREDVPEDVVAAERETLETISRNEGKPEAALPKIVEGRLGGFFKEVVLLEQAYVRDQKVTIEKLLDGAELVRFGQTEIGS
ncbi:MAG: translation elongation factor Ts [Actinomycetota bacterium]